MNVRDLIPWSRNEERLPVARRDERSDPVSTLRSDIDRLFDQAFGSFGLPSFASTPSWPNIEVRRKDGELLVTAEVPGWSFAGSDAPRTAMRQAGIPNASTANSNAG